MNIAFFTSDKKYSNNKFFDINSSRDNVLEPFHLLRSELSSKGIELNTFDIVAHEKIDIAIVHRIDVNFNNLIQAIKTNPYIKIIYIVTEERTICPYHTARILKTHLFDLVLTWDDKVIDNKYFFKYNYPNPVRNFKSNIAYSDKKFITMINGYKHSYHNKKGELYSKRLDILKFFSDKGCDLYGVGWEKCPHKQISDIYKGTVSSKLDTLQNYKFSICFENTSNEYGAITEKIFDCFASGCVPIYYGAPNINEYIPANCFIHYSDFSSDTELYIFLCSIDKRQYDSYLNSIKVFLESDEYRSFNSYGYIDYVWDAIDIVSKKNRRQKNIFTIKLEWIKNIFTQPSLLYTRVGIKLLLKNIFS